MADNCTVAAICASVKPASGSSSIDSKIQLIIIALTVVNTILSMATPFLAKARAVQEVVFPNRTAHRREVKQKIETAIAAMQEAVQTISQRSDSERSDVKQQQQLSAPAKKKSVDVLV